MNDKQIDELKKLSKPLQDFLVSNFDPHCRVVISYDGAYIIGALTGVPMPVVID